MCYNYCSICLSKIYKQKIKLNCNHFYHKECLKEWLNYNNTCPICRIEIDNEIINIINNNNNIINNNIINNNINCDRFYCNKIKDCKEYLNFLNIKQNEYNFINSYNCNSKYNIINLINNIIFFILFWILIILFFFIIGFVFYNINLLFSINNNSSFYSEFKKKFNKIDTYIIIPLIGIFCWIILSILYKCYKNINID